MANPFDIPLPKPEEMLKRLMDFLFSCARRNVASGGGSFDWLPIKNRPRKLTANTIPLGGANGRIYRSLKPSMNVNDGWVRVDTSGGDKKTQIIAHVHNFGRMNYEINVTAKSRRYFVYMYHVTGDDDWLRMAFKGTKGMLDPLHNAPDMKIFRATTPRRRFLWLTNEDIKQAKEITGGMPLTITDGIETIHA